MNLFRYLAELANQAWPFILQVGGGGVTGYETNKWALRLLFREYWGFGGYIVKTRRQFTESISELVESDIINARTLAPYLHGRELEEQVQALVRELLGNQLRRKTQAVRVGDIPGSVSSLEHLAAFAETRGSDFARSFLDRLIPGVPLTGLLGTAQRHLILRALVDLDINVLGESDLLVDFFNGLCEEYRELRVADLLSATVMEQLVTNLRAGTANLHVRLRDRYELQLDELWRGLSSQLETDELVRQVEAELLSRTPAELLGYDDGRKALAELLGRVLDFVNSEQGRTALGGLVEAAVTTARGSSTPVVELLGDEARASIVSFLERELPGVIEQLIGWVEANRPELEELLEEAVTETLSEHTSSPSGAMAGLRQWLYKSFAGGNVARQFGIVGRVITALEEGQDGEAVHSLAEEAADQLISYLGSQSLGELIQAAERNGIIDVRQLGESAVSGLRRIVRDILEAGVPVESDHRPAPDVESRPQTDSNLGAGPQADSDLASEPQDDSGSPGTPDEKSEPSSLATTLSDWAASLLDTALADLAPGSLALLLGARDPARLAWKWFKESYLFTPRSTRALQAVGTDWLEGLRIRPLAEVLDAQALTALIMDLLEQPGVRGFLLAEANRAVSSLVEGRTLASVLSPGVRTRLGAVAGREMASLLRDMTDEYRAVPLATLYDRLDAADPVRIGLSRVLVELLEQHLGSFLSGRVAHIVADNLDDLPDERLRELVEEFMGEHLGPITWLGALVGGAIGTVLYYLQTLGWNATGYLQASLVYGFAGWITNVMALWAIFKPYEQKRLFGVPIPLTPGIVAKNKARFAVSMGEFVDEKLLSAESLNQAFRDNREVAETALKTYLTQRGPAIVTEVLYANSNLGTIADGAAAMAQKQALQHESDLTRWVARLIRGIELKQFDLASIEDTVEESVLKGLDRLPQLVSGHLSPALATTQPVGEVLPDVVKSALYHGLEGAVRTGFRRLEEMAFDPERLGELVTGLLEPLLAEWQHKTVAQVMGLDEGELSDRLAAFIVRQLQSPERRHAVTGWLRARLSPVAADRTLGDLAGGSLVRLASDNADLLADTLVDHGLALLDGQREAIKDLIGSALQETNPLLAFLNLRRLTDDVVDRVIDEKLPVYLEQRRDDTRAFVDGLVSTVGRRPLGDLGLETAVATALEGAGWLLERIVADPGAVEAITRLVQPVTTPVQPLRLSSVLEFVRVNRPEDIVTRFERELEAARLHVVRHLGPKGRGSPTPGATNTRAEVENMVSGAARLMLDDLLDELPVDEVTGGIGPDTLAPSVEALVGRLRSSPVFRSALGRFLGGLRRRVESSTVGDFAAEELLAEDLHGALDELLRSGVLVDALRPELENVVLALDEALPELVDAETWDYLTSVVVQALLEAMSVRLPGLVGAVDLAEVTERELRQMSPTKIEQLFNSFASRYFARLRLYGWFGAGFGLLVEALRQLLLGM